MSACKECYAAVQDGRPASCSKHPMTTRPTKSVEELLHDAYHLAATHQMPQEEWVTTVAHLARSMAEQVAKRVIGQDEVAPNVQFYADGHADINSAVNHGVVVGQSELRASQRQSLPTILDDIFDTKGDV